MKNDRCEACLQTEYKNVTQYFNLCQRTSDTKNECPTYANAAYAGYLMTVKELLAANAGDSGRSEAFAPSICTCKGRGLARLN
jgi:hypothetical protein